MLLIFIQGKREKQIHFQSLKTVQNNGMCWNWFSWLYRCIITKLTMSNIKWQAGKKHTPASNWLYKQDYKEHINLARKMHSQVSECEDPSILRQWHSKHRGRCLTWIVTIPFALPKPTRTSSDRVLSPQQRAYTEFWFCSSACPSFSSWPRRHSWGCWKDSPCCILPCCSS